MDFRLDRLATLYVVSPLLHLGSRGEQSIPILMYHSIADEDESNAHPYYRTTTSPAMFAAHLKYLHEGGYKTCSLAQAMCHLLGEPQTSAKFVVITFDDGYRDFYRAAFPVLNQYGFSAMVFLPTAYIGDNPIPFKGKDCLAWSEVRELNKYGTLFGSHTVTHPQLRELSIPAIQEEIVNSKKTIEEKMGCPVDCFAYPFAFPEENVSFVRMVRATLIEAGYRLGVSTRIGMARQQEDCYFLPRLPMNSMDDIPLFDAKLQGGYDWLHSLQYASKFIKARVLSHD
jgi:peptidoglycan/xylan/chitin deacetylase (PgdA/CDA1 family)